MKFQLTARPAQIYVFHKKSSAKDFITRTFDSPAQEFELKSLIATANSYEKYKKFMNSKLPTCPNQPKS